jgi:uncharacterized protein with PIN domain
MTMLTEEVSSRCPYCGEPISLVVDESIPEQEYIEDCQVCCQPMVLHVTVEPDGEVRVEIRREDDA